ncbi:MAG: formate dehydrogenase accessory protein FdhE [Bacillati bacterium ANGP1]|uniref:Protein FdhE homolog n=1 Tax=Candidatus Segetimicrobium genomatis TaxID=2569760 RepID=A0A537K6L4_9BACT|nr:MAG: formate dehydrogenase accessory protein FdhE [Gammaproteobacteria bacterium]TMI91384.1 MAG: formate dehydrogenase accessory protein FdhE [Terrabacteria group bacterium ANGP1]
MPRILEPGQIEASAGRAIPRIRFPERTCVFSARAQRLRQLAEAGAPGHAIGDYLRLMAVMADAQQLVLGSFEAAAPTAHQLARAATHRMPVIHASSWPRAPYWREVVTQLCGAVAAARDAPAGVRATCEQLQSAPAPALETQADALLGGRTEAVDVGGAPFLMAALQVYWVTLASRLLPDQVPGLEVPGLCPACGTLPVASIVRAEARSEGYRFLHCALCATEWHLVRITCSQCQSTANIAYHSIEGDSGAVRAESCDQCHTYRKILYQEKDTNVDPVADDLGSLALDLLMSEAGYHRGSGNPLLWQRP